MVQYIKPAEKVVYGAPECRYGKCVNVTFDNVPGFAFALDREVEVPGLGRITVDVGYGGMIYAIVDAASLGFRLELKEAAQLVEVGERIKAPARGWRCCTPKESCKWANVFSIAR